MISTKHSRIQDSPIVERRGAVLRIVGNGESLTLIRFDQEPGAVTPTHTHINEQVGTCISGSGKLVSGGVTLHVEPGVSWVIPSCEPHSFTVDSVGPVLIFEAFSPPRMDYVSEAKQP